MEQAKFSPRNSRFNWPSATSTANRFSAKYDTPRSSPPHFELTRYEACGLRLILVIRGRRYSMHESIVLCPACHRQANPSEFRANRRKSKSRRLQFVVVMSEECPFFFSPKVLPLAASKAQLEKIEKL